jgi:hypothetical protein
MYSENALELSIYIFIGDDSLSGGARSRLQVVDANRGDELGFLRTIS